MVQILHTEQLHHENKAWVRLLEFFKQENYFMKNRLSEVLDHAVDKDFLALAEQFQNKFILKDEYIDELRHDINKQDQLLNDLEGRVDNKMAKMHSKLKDQMEYFEKDFNKLKDEFNKYIYSAL
ncbi:MAG: hypothetical protein JNM14_15250 [Ferruginibacter sp.]|nr:hypothetical protein [Ferruginibacter sp.]